MVIFSLTYMKATEILASEHRLIEQLLTVLETAAWLLVQDPCFEAQFFITAAGFITEFADGFHHMKEEGILFQAMIENGMPRDGSFVAAMLHEHDLGRTYTSGLRSSAERLLAGDNSYRPAVVHYARHYASLLRNHIQIEDKIVFPLASELIPIAQQEIIWRRFEQTDIALGADQKAMYQKIVYSLEKKVEL